MTRTWREMLKTFIAESETMIRKVLLNIITAAQDEEWWPANLGGLSRHNWSYKKLNTHIILVKILTMEIGQKFQLVVYLNACILHLNAIQPALNKFKINHYKPIPVCFSFSSFCCFSMFCMVAKKVNISKHCFAMFQMLCIATKP